jgi:hypothetical protein
LPIPSLSKLVKEKMTLFWRSKSPPVALTGISTSTDTTDVYKQIRSAAKSGRERAEEISTFSGAEEEFDELSARNSQGF